MKKGKKIYILLLILIVLVMSTMYFSYAFFADKREEHGKLNIVVGTLDYKMESNSLNYNSIEVGTGNSFEFIIKITSLNNVDSKYELYYNLSKKIEHIEVGYSVTTNNSPKGIIHAKESKEIKVIVKNNSEDKVKITFGVHGGFITTPYDDIKEYGLEIKNAIYVASDVFYTSNKSKICVDSNQHVECAIQELKSIIGN